MFSIAPVERSSNTGTVPRGDQLLGQMASDEARPTGDQVAH